MRVLRFSPQKFTEIRIVFLTRFADKTHGVFNFVLLQRSGPF